MIVIMKVYTKKILQQKRLENKKQQTIDSYLKRKFYRLRYRCNTPTCPSYKYYGRRGIQVKFKSVKSFVVWVKYILGFDTLDKLKGLEIDRIDNNGHYEPGNIRFVTRTENNQNKRNSKKKRCPYCGGKL